MSKKGKHTGNVYRQQGKDGWIIRWRDAQGRRRSRLVKVDSEEEARKSLFAEKSKAERNLQLETVSGQKPPTDESFECFAAEFLKFQEKRISPRVAKGKLSRTEFDRQKGIVEQHLKPFFGSMRLASIRKADVVHYIQARTGEVADGTVIKEANVLKRLFNVALDYEKISANPAQRAPLPKAPEGRTRYLTPDESRMSSSFAASNQGTMIQTPSNGCSKPQDWPSRWVRGAAN